jgi:hypothetical protein
LGETEAHRVADFDNALPAERRPRHHGASRSVIAIGIVSAKPTAHFRSTPGGYFHGMVEKAKAANLNLAPTIWGLRQDTALTSRCGPSQSAAPANRRRTRTGFTTG